MENITAGEGVRAVSIRAVPQIGSLFSEKKAFSKIAVEGLAMPQAYLAPALFGKMKGDGLVVGRFTAIGVKLDGPVPLPPLDIDLSFKPDGAVRSAILASAENKIAVQIQPEGDTATVELTAGTMAVPFVSGLNLSDFSLKGTVTATEMNVSAWEGRIYDGGLSGTARIRWGAIWNIEGDVLVKQMNVNVLAPALMSDGRADARGKFVMSGPAPAKLGAEARIEGRFSVTKGVLGSFDLARSLQSGRSQANGRTLFSELTGLGIYSKGTVQLHDMKLTAGLLTGSGNAEIDAGGNLSGRINAELGSGPGLARGTLMLGGTSKEPAIRR